VAISVAQWHNHHTPNNRMKSISYKKHLPLHPLARKEMIVESAINHLPLFLMSSLSYFKLINSSSLAPESSQVKLWDAANLNKMHGR